MSNLQSASNAYQAQDFLSCVQYCESELAANPGSLDALTLLAFAHLQQKDRARGRQALERLIDATPPGVDVMRFHRLLGATCCELEDNTAAKQAFLKALDSAPDDVFTLSHLVSLGYSLGDVALSRQCAAELRRHLPGTDSNTLNQMASVIGLGVSIAGLTVPDDAASGWLTTLDELVVSQRCPTLCSEFNFLFGYARFLERAGEFARALDAWRSANRTQRGQGDYSVDRQLEDMRWAEGVFDRAYFDRDLAATPMPGDPQPVFVVGMPRSGTTLMEQILGSHSRVQALGELPHLANSMLAAAAERGADAITSLLDYDKALVARIRELYLSKIRGLTGASVFTDKMPDNLNRVWLIRHAFPEARIVCTSRQKFANVMSCFTISFDKGVGYSNSLRDCAAYYEQARQLAAHWEALLADRFKIFSYEQLVADSENQIPALLAHAGLDPEPACFSPHELQRVAGTWSTLQVTQPLYADGNRRWEPYRDLLGDDTSWLTD